MEPGETGLDLYGQDRYLEALIHYELILTGDPNNSAALMGKAISLDQLGYHEDALEYCARSTAVVPGNVERLRDMGNIMSSTRQLGKARVYYEDALSVEPRDVESLMGLGDVLIGLGLYDKAIACFSRVLDIDHRNTGALLEIARTLAMQGNHKAARVCSKDILRREPRNIDALLIMGFSSHMLGMQDEARACIKRAWDLGPGNEMVATAAAVVRGRQ